MARRLTFWRDDWTGLGPLRGVIHRPLNELEDTRRVNGVINEEGEWDWTAVIL